VALETGQQPPRLDASRLTNAATLGAALAEEFDRWQQLLAGLSDAQVDGDVTLTTARGQRGDVAYWRVLQHLAFHNMQHATELAQLLTAQGHSPGDLDFIFYGG
jgi:uncharacterized damage-inducible protein DinB